jgi:hypothetical protein
MLRLCYKKTVQKGHHNSATDLGVLLDNSHSLHIAASAFLFRQSLNTQTHTACFMWLTMLRTPLVYIPIHHQNHQSAQQLHNSTARQFIRMNQEARAGDIMQHHVDCIYMPADYARSKCKARRNKHMNPQQLVYWCIGLLEQIPWYNEQLHICWYGLTVTWRSGCWYRGGNRDPAQGTDEDLTVTVQCHMAITPPQNHSSHHRSWSY